MTEHSLSKNAILSELTKSPHGKLTEYVPMGKRAAEEESEFFAHLISWNHAKGAIRDAKVALPIIALTSPKFVKEGEFKENALAHIVKLGPRELKRALSFAKDLKVPGRGRQLYNLVRRYLQARERNWGKWERLAIQHRATLASLYGTVHLKPRLAKMGEVLFMGAAPEGSLFEAVRNLGKMSSLEAAGTIAERKIPFLIAAGALGTKMKETDLMLALINRMTPVELVTNATMLERYGLKTNPALKAAWEEKLGKAGKSRKSVLKTSHQAGKVKDATIKAQMNALQEKQLANLSVEGNWIVLADKSGSMSAAIETGRLIAGVLSKMARGKVTLIFFDTVPSRVFDVTGQTLEQIQSDTRHVRADGGTSIGCGMQYAIDRNVEADGVAIVSDGGENNYPDFAATFKRYCEKIGKEIPVYFYHLDGEGDVLTASMRRAGLDMQEFDLRRMAVDYYSIQNLVTTMRTQRYGLIEEVMSAPLVTVDEVFAKMEAEIESELLPEGLEGEREEEPSNAA